jgi:hypothetical protein
MFSVYKMEINKTNISTYQISGLFVCWFFLRQFDWYMFKSTLISKTISGETCFQAVCDRRVVEGLPHL